MEYLRCAAACGDFDLCLIACPHNQYLDGNVILICDCAREELMDNDEAWIVVIEEKPSKVE